MDKETGQIAFEELLKSEDAAKLGDRKSDAMAKTIEETMVKSENVVINIKFDDLILRILTG